ncbi:hypothetical protein QE152_g23164 [Popillia japonica]|uniref:Uncharacterized protein n=1 Tax=Popillia japonica TaxID=7064 RepID=A0AAW1KHY3_POPJA
MMQYYHRLICILIKYIRIVSPQILMVVGIHFCYGATQSLIFVQDFARDGLNWKFVRRLAAVSGMAVLKLRVLIGTSNGCQKEEVKFLGLVLTSSLNWSRHVDNLRGTLASAIFSIRRLQQTATYEASRSAYFAMFESRATYGILLWGASSAMETIFRLQKEAVRALAGVPKRTTCRNLYPEHQILTLSKSQLTTNHLAIKLYNQLPAETKGMSKRSFHRAVKEFLMQQTFYSVEDYLTYKF